MFSVAGVVGLSLRGGGSDDGGKKRERDQSGEFHLAISSAENVGQDGILSHDQFGSPILLSRRAKDHAITNKKARPDQKG
jgi:hypothetical protein